MLSVATIKAVLSVSSIKGARERIEKIVDRLPSIKKIFVSRSLSFLEDKAKEHLNATTGGSSWYQLTHTLENSFKIDEDVGRLINDCFYSAFVEYGTGVVGKGTHPAPKDYKYDVSGHANNGWFFYKDGQIHWTKGMKAHRYMYNALVDYYFKEEYKEIFYNVVKESLEEV